MKQLFTFLITLYQILLSPILKIVFGAQCRHEISCSEYMKQSIKKHGVIKGLKLGFVRLLSCQPFGRIQTT